jgi:hypothetical protein
MLRILQPRPQPPPFILLPPILAPAANTGVLFNHGIYEAAATAATAVAMTTMRVAAANTDKLSTWHPEAAVVAITVAFAPAAAAVIVVVVAAIVADIVATAGGLAAAVAPWRLLQLGACGAVVAAFPR